MVHFFLYDYRFERVWKNPDSDIEKLSRYRAVLSPDFSMYLEMATVMQLYNVFRNRWCGAYWASNPNKPQDQRFLGKPGEIKTTYKNGYRVDTKIGEDGRAVTERHYTDHKQPWAHTNPHDHPIHWNNPAGYPDPQPAINYPNGAPEFKQWREACNMIKNTVSPDNPSEQNRFVSISDFKTCMKWHGEVEFMWNENLYSITPRSNGRISISMAYREDTEKLCDTSDEVLEYMVGSDRLRDVITQVTVLDRSI